MVTQERVKQKVIDRLCSTCKEENSSESMLAALLLLATERADK